MLLVAKHFTTKMIQRIADLSLDFTPMASSLLASPKLCDADVEYMLMEFLFGGVDTVRL